MFQFFVGIVVGIPQQAHEPLDTTQMVPVLLRFPED
jgi:hypothetical protein